jgi:hypothetical protein
MCGPVYESSFVSQCNSSANGKEAGRQLARLMERQLGYVEGHIDSVALRLFIRAYWSRVSKFAHEIHDDNE